MLNMGRCFAWFFESRSNFAHLGSIIVLVVNSFFVIYLHVNDPNKDYNNNNNNKTRDNVIESSGNLQVSGKQDTY